MGNDHLLQIRVSKDFLRALDIWRRLQDDLPARAEAIRRLTSVGIVKTTTRAPQSDELAWAQAEVKRLGLR